MSLSQAFFNANQGLSMAARATEIVSTNIANAQTEGYVKRSILVSERVVAGQSVGLQPVKVHRNEASIASERVRRSEITYQQQEVISEASKKIVAAIGDVDSDFSLSSVLDSFRNALKNLAETPENASLQDQTIVEAKKLTQTVQDIALSMQEIREDADKTIKAEVDSLNNYLNQLQEVNGEITSLSGSRDISALQDEQERLINKVNEILPVNTSFSSQGIARLATKSGVTILDISVAKIEFTQTSYITPDKIYSYAGDEPGLPYNSVLSGITISGLDLTPTANKVQSIQGGRLGGLFQVRDEFTTTVQKQIDTIAGHLITAFRDGDPTTDTDADTVNGDVDSLFTAGSVAGTDYSTLSSVLGISNSLTINAKFDPENGGDKRRIRDGAEATIFDTAPGNASIIQSWISQTEQLRSFDVTTDMTQSQSIMSSVREFVSYSSLKNQNELRNFTYEEGKLNSLKDIRDNLEGVNIDEQTQQMLLMQKIYEANAVLLKTANEMLQTLLDINR